MNNKFEDIKPYLSQTELDSIEKINERIKSLEQKTTNYFSEFDSVSLENIEEGYVRNSDLDALTDKYVDLINDFQSEIKELHDEVEPATINKLADSEYKNIGKENYQIINGTISNFGKFFTMTDKLEAIDLIVKVRNSQMPEEEKNELIELIQAKKERIRMVVNSENMVKLKKMTEDVEEIEKLSIEKVDRRKRMNWKQHLAIWIAIIIVGVIVGVMIWAWS